MAVYRVEWGDTGPFYHGIPSLTIVYRGKPLSFSTRDIFPKMGSDYITVRTTVIIFWEKIKGRWS